MADRKYYVICELGCRFESMTKEQILTAITQAVNEGTIGDIDTGFVTTIKTINGKGLKFFVGTQSEYEALTDEEKDDLFAIITNDTSKEALENALAELQTNYETLTEGLTSGSFEVAKATSATSATTATKATSATNATYATSAGSATKATKDGEGNVISETYAKKSDKKYWHQISISGNTYVLLFSVILPTDTPPTDTLMNLINAVYEVAKNKLMTASGVHYGTTNTSVYAVQENGYGGTLKVYTTGGVGEITTNIFSTHTINDIVTALHR